MTPDTYLTTYLAALNSATKYPSIPTYHQLDPEDGSLLETVMLFDGQVTLTEKVDGTNARIILLPDGDWFIGSREELLIAKGDRVFNQMLSIVETLYSLARMVTLPIKSLAVLYLEVYGHGIGSNAKQYTTGKSTGYRLFDIAFVQPNVLGWPRDRIASWRDHGGQDYIDESMLQQVSSDMGIPLTPRLGSVDAGELPVSIEDTHEWLTKHLPSTQVRLDEDGNPQNNRAEGIVLRNDRRKIIAKAKLNNYERTLRLRK